MPVDRLEEELEGLYREHYPRFLRVAIAITGDDAAAHDVVQETFARAIRSSGSFRGDGTLEAWIWAILVNSARATRRSQLAGIAADEAPDAAATEHGDEEGLRPRIAALPERQRLVVFLRYYADLDYEAIAAALGIKVGTVSATLNAAHASLRHALEEVRS